ncbi:MAG TPA: nuclear transport factor 2 family protein [Puia sp.]|jgi:ketosteroid isomerase-like protein|nr:nuclear transport factor 2 family protein [Puia sp.]
MKKIISAAILIFTIICAHAQNKDIEIVKRVEQMRVSALITKDTAALNKIYADDVIFINTLGETLDKKRVLSLIVEPDRKYTTASIDSFTSVRIIGVTAVLMTKTTLIRTLHNVVSTLHNSQMAVYEKRRNKWLLVALHTTLLNAK